MPGCSVPLSCRLRRAGQRRFVNTLIAHTRGGFNGDRDALVRGLGDGSLTRSAVLRQVVENEGFINTSATKRL